MGRPKLYTAEEAKIRRRETIRKSQERRRAKMRDAGALEIRIIFRGEDAALLRSLRPETNVPLDSWAPKCFLTGAKFLFNSGNVRGGKKRIRESQTT